MPDYKFPYQLNSQKRKQHYGHGPALIWFYGPSGSGKSTLCDQLNQKLLEKKMKTLILDGDWLRETVNQDLGFSEHDRDENIRRALEIAKIAHTQGLIVLCSFITPFEKQRQLIQSQNLEHTHLVYIKTSMEKLIQRDTKGLYQKAMQEKFSNQLSGVGQNFDETYNCDLVIDTSKESIEKSAERLMDYIFSQLSSL